MSVGMLTGRPAEEMPGSTGDLLPELSQLHERVRQVMRGVAQALWPSISMPEGIGGLGEELKGARQCRGKLPPRAPMGTETLFGSAGGGGRTKSRSRRSTRAVYPASGRTDA